MGAVGIFVLAYVAFPVFLFLAGYMLSSGLTRGYFDAIKSQLKYGKKEK